MSEEPETVIRAAQHAIIHGGQFSNMPARCASVSVLDEIGDRTAPKGSRPWALWLLGVTKLTRDELERDSSSLKELLERLHKHKAWKALGVPSFDMLCTTELRLSSDEVEAIQASGTHQKLGIVLAKAQHAREQAVEVRRGNNQHTVDVDNVNIHPAKRGGNGSEYLLRRLAKTAPDILDRYEAGEFKSVRAASIAAGHIKVATVLERLLKLWEKATEAERSAFRQHTV